MTPIFRYLFGEEIDLEDAEFALVVFKEGVNLLYDIFWGFALNDNFLGDDYDDSEDDFFFIWGTQDISHFVDAPEGETEPIFPFLVLIQPLAKVEHHEYHHGRLQ